MSIFFGKVIQYMSSHNIVRENGRRVLHIRLRFEDFDQIERDGYLRQTGDIRLNGTRIGVSGMTIQGAQGEYANVSAAKLSSFWNAFKYARETGDYHDLSVHLKWFHGSGTKGFWDDIEDFSDFKDFSVDVKFRIDKNFNEDTIDDFVRNYDDYRTTEQLREGHGIDSAGDKYTQDKVLDYYKSLAINNQQVIHHSHRKILQRIAKRKKEQIKWMPAKN